MVRGEAADEGGEKPITEVENRYRQTNNRISCILDIQRQNEGDIRMEVKY